jgi:hypothetical protein
MAYIDSNAHTVRISLGTTASESLIRVIDLFNALANSKLKSDRLKAIFLFATEGSNVHLVIVMDCYISDLHTYQILDGPVFAAANIELIREFLHVADECQTKLLADGKPPIIGDNLKVLYCGRPAPRTDEMDLPYDAADALLKHFWVSSVPRPNSEGFLRLFENA